MKNLNNDEDITIDLDEENLDDSVVTEMNQKDAILKLKEKLKIAESQSKEYLDGWQRAKADFINIRKRDEESKQDFLKFSKEEIVRDIIPVLDSFELAFKNKESMDSLPKEWRAGMESIYNQLVAVLSSHGVEKLNPVGETFDPKLHEAMQMIPVLKKEDDGKIIEVIQTGYSLLGKEVRSPKVLVGAMSE